MAKKNKNISIIKKVHRDKTLGLDLSTRVADKSNKKKDPKAVRRKWKQERDK